MSRIAIASAFVLALASSASAQRMVVSFGAVQQPVYFITPQHLICDSGCLISTTLLATSANQTTELASLASIDGKTPALGQALAASSVPVILPSATITTLTPPAAITGFALDSSLTAIQAVLQRETQTQPLLLACNALRRTNCR